MRVRILAVVLAAFAAAPAHADEHAGTVVARVGARTITVGEMEARLRRLTPLQLRSYGSTPEQIRKKFLEDVLVPEVLLESGADARKLATQYPTSYDVDRTKADATLRAIHKQIGPSSSISDDDARKYYEEHKDLYDAPERYNLWRIVLGTKEEADAVLADAKKDLTPDHWNKLAREKSIDKTSSMRGGNLGFVSADGSSNESGTKIDPVVVKAAQAVKDGELLPVPIEEPIGWSVVWKRGTVGASKRTFEESAAQIKDTLFKQRVEREMKKLTDKLRSEKVKDYTPDILDTIDLTQAEGSIVPKKRPGQVPPIGAPSK